MSASPWEHPTYYWVVICKNKRFHGHANIWAGHKIVLGDTDAVAPLPEVGKSIQVQCDECDHEYSYKPKEVLRLELQLAESVTPHPLFVDKPPGTTAAASQWAAPSLTNYLQSARSFLANAVQGLRRQRGRGQKNA